MAGPISLCRVSKVAETGNISLDHEQAPDQDLINTIDEVSLAYTTREDDGLYTQIESKDTEDEPDLMDLEIWIGDTGATTYSMAHDKATCNHRNATPVDNVFGVTQPPAKAKTIVDILATLMELSSENKRIIHCKVTKTFLKG